MQLYPNNVSKKRLEELFYYFYDKSKPRVLFFRNLLMADPNEKQEQRRRRKSNRPTKMRHKWITRQHDTKIKSMTMNFNVQLNNVNGQ